MATGDSGFLFHYLVTKQLKEEVRSLREQNAQLSRGRIATARDSRQLDRENFELRARILDLELTLSNHEADHVTTREREREEDQQAIDRAIGLLDRALVETEGLQSSQLYFAPTGHCWHFSSECQGLRNSRRVEQRDACIFCLSNRLPPWIPNGHTGRTLKQDIEAFFRLHGRVSYIDSLVYY